MLNCLDYHESVRDNIKEITNSHLNDPLSLNQARKGEFIAVAG